MIPTEPNWDEHCELVKDIDLLCSRIEILESTLPDLVERIHQLIEENKQLTIRLQLVPGMMP